MKILDQKFQNRKRLNSKKKNITNLQRKYQFLSCKIKFVYINSHTLRPKPPSEKLIKYVTELGTLLENTEDEEEKATLIQNANKEIRGMEVSLSCDKNCSFLIQILLKNSGVYQLYQYLEYSYDFMNHLLTDPYASHVMETIFQLIYDFLSKGFCGYRRGGYSEEEREQNQSITSEQIIESVSKIIEKIGGNVSLIASDSCGSHVFLYNYY